MDQPVVPLRRPRAERAERADTTRNRQHLLSVAREMLAGQGAGKLTMDGLAREAGLGKGTVFRRFGSRAGIFRALLDEAERDFQEQVLSGPPALGPGAAALDRLIAYGKARARFLATHREIARASLDGGEPLPAGERTPMSQPHIRMLLGQLDLGAADLAILSLQLTAALDGPLMLYLSTDDLSGSPDHVLERIERGWEELVRRVCRGEPMTKATCEPRREGPRDPPGTARPHPRRPRPPANRLLSQEPEDNGMPLTGEYQPSALAFARDQAELYERSGGTTGTEQGGDCHR